MVLFDVVVEDNGMRSDSQGKVLIFSASFSLFFISLKVMVCMDFSQYGFKLLLTIYFIDEAWHFFVCCCCLGFWVFVFF